MQKHQQSRTRTLGGTLKPLTIFLHLWPKEPSALVLAQEELAFTQRQALRMASSAEQALADHTTAKVACDMLRDKEKRLKADIERLKSDHAPKPVERAYAEFMSAALDSKPGPDTLPHTYVGGGPKPIIGVRKP